MRKFAMLAFVVFGCSGAGQDSDDSPETLCARVRDHVIELRLADASAVEHAPHRDALKAALGEGFISRCASSMTDEQLSCALNATDSSAVTACAGGN